MTATRRMTICNKMKQVQCLRTIFISRINTETPKARWKMADSKEQDSLLYATYEDMCKRLMEAADRK